MSDYACHSLEALDALDSVELMEGYHDGYSGAPEPGANRSPSYHHGWWTGSADGRHRPSQPWMRELAHLHVERGRRNRALATGTGVGP